MLNGRTFRLHDDILVIEILPDGTKAAQIIPAGEMLMILRGPQPDAPWLLDIIWQTRTYSMFAEDIKRRSVEILAKRKLGFLEDGCYSKMKSAD